MTRGWGLRRLPGWCLLVAWTGSQVFGAAPRTEAAAVTPRDATWHAKWHERIAAARKAGGADFGIVLIGDSILDLWPTKGARTYATFLPWKPLNLGISGENTEHVLHRITHGQLDGLRPRVAMILIGTNNLGHSRDQPEWVAAGVSKVVETVRSRLPGTRILLFALLPRGGDRGPDGVRPNSQATDAIRRQVSRTNELIAPLADGQQVFFQDLGPLFLRPDGSLRMDLMPDALHPNEDGYAVWLEAIRPRLEELMKGAEPAAGR